jgi:hypothetical protein
MGEHPQEVRHHAQLALDGIQKAALFGVGAFIANDGNTVHDNSPNNERVCHMPV